MAPDPQAAPSVPPLGDTLARLYTRIPLGIRLGLEPMREACSRLGLPERAFAAVHVAGTNGKGSVCAMVEAILRAEGAKTGLYTSPNLCRFAERIRVAGEPIADATLSRHLTKALDAGAELSFFEAATLAAFLAFREAGVDIAVIEVGIGGRLDATNVIPAPRAAAITRIAMDHADRLGATLVEIAREKAGIAKPGMDIIVGPASPEIRAAIDEVAHANGATTTGIDGASAPTRIALAGLHQQANARVASALGARLGASSRAIEHGIARVEWPGRLELIEARSPRGEERSFLLDAAHNVDGAQALGQHLRALGRNPGEVTLVFGALADKDWASMLDILSPLADRRVYVEPGGSARGSVDPGLMRARHDGVVADAVEDALVLASDFRHRSSPTWPTRAAMMRSGRLREPPLVVVAGSILLVGRARALLLGLPCDAPVGL
ncbi:MAG: Mur ligase family protein [Myxococcota bacterium]|nr:Mur ligase family protein [Myxococcota bacterium]